MKKLLLLIVIICANTQTILAQGNIIINEINYNSNDSFDPDDWIELYNPNEVSLNLSGWAIKDEDDTHEFIIPENIIIEANGYFVFTKDSSKFKAMFPNVTNYVGDLGYGLGGGGDKVRLFHQSGELIDTLEYDDKEPWPECADGDGPTLELSSWSSDNTIAESWQCGYAYGSPAKENGDGLGLSDLSNKSIRIYPNPTETFITISSSTEPIVEIFDISGHLHIKTSKSEVNIAHLPNALYIVKVRDKNTLKESIYKVIKK